MGILTKADKYFDKLANLCGYISIICLCLLVIDVFFSVCARYIFSYTNNAIQELQWHFFALSFLFGMSYALKDDAHVRVDVFYDGMKPKNKAIVNMIGTILFIFPFAFLVAYLSPDYIMEAYTSQESSPDNGGLSHRWIIKSFIVICYFILIVVAIGYFIKNLNAYMQIIHGQKVKFLESGASGTKGI